MAYLSQLVYGYDEEEEGTGLGLNVREAAEKPYFKRALEEGNAGIDDPETVRRNFQKLLAVDGTSIVMGWVTSSDFYEEVAPRGCCRWDLRPSTQCLILKSPKTQSIVVAFRGTGVFERDGRDIASDLKIWRGGMWGEEDPDVQVHDGFMEAYQREVYRRPAKGGGAATSAPAVDGQEAEGAAEVEAEAEADEAPDKQYSAIGVGARIEEIIEKAFKDPDVVESGVPWTVYVTGHSLGGALALLCSYRLAVLDKGGLPGNSMVKTILFGAPRVGNLQFKEKLKRSKAQIWQLQNGNDIVTCVPFGRDFAHPGYTINLREKKGSVVAAVTGSEVRKMGPLWPLKKTSQAFSSLLTGGGGRHKIKSYIDLLLLLKKDPSVWVTSADMPPELNPGQK